LRGIYVHRGLKVYFDNAKTGNRLRLDMFDIVDRCGQGAFIEIDDAARHVVGGQTGEAPNYANDRGADIRENIDWRPDRG
jgi:hypothetical protein